MESVTPTSDQGPSRRIPSSLFTICTAMTSTLELDALLELILELAMQEFQAQRGSVLLCDEMTDSLKMLAARGMPDEVARKGYIPRQGSIAEWVLANDRPVVLHDTIDDRRFTSISEKRLRSSMCCPLRSKGKVIGTLNISRVEEGLPVFDDDDQESMLIIATQAAVAIENARLVRENLESARMAAIGQTVAGVSHCVKNILTGLKGGMSLGEMAIRQQDWEMMKGGWEMLSRAVGRISLLVLDMLDYSKERKPSRHPTDLTALVEEVCLSVSYDAGKRHIILERDAPEDLPRPLIDGDQIFRCLMNLATNAIDAVSALEAYHNRQGRVIFRARVMYQSPGGAGANAMGGANGEAPGGLARNLIIEVIDNGCGIEPERLQDIFQPFFSTKGSRGTGIGLAVTRKVAREHGGRVEVDSVLGEGSTFRIILPCQVAETVGADPVVRPAPSV